MDENKLDKFAAMIAPLVILMVSLFFTCCVPGLFATGDIVGGILLSISAVICFAISIAVWKTRHLID